MCFNLCHEILIRLSRKVIPRLRPLSLLYLCFVIITKTRLFKYIENFTNKNWKFSDKTSDILYISAQNIDCGYSLERVHTIYVLSRNKKNNVYPCKPQFYYIKWSYYIKWGLMGSTLYTSVVCFRDVIQTPRLTTNFMQFDWLKAHFLHFNKIKSRNPSDLFSFRRLQRLIF